MRVSYQRMDINVPFDAVHEIEYFELKESLNNHSTVCIKFLVDEDKIKDILLRMDGASAILIVNGR